MNNEQRTKNAIKWIDRLLVSRLRQSREKLGDKEYGFCCLGLACDILKVDFKCDDTISKKLVDLIGLNGVFGSYHLPDGFNVCGKELTSLNDEKEFSFKKIAHAIIAEPNRYLKPKVAQGIKAHYGAKP